jgi:hypothetical protein
MFPLAILWLFTKAMRHVFPGLVGKVKVIRPRQLWALPRHFVDFCSSNSSANCAFKRVSEGVLQANSTPWDKKIHKPAAK